jgi:oxygen-dependent protoporphyrinogen oxidase
MTRTPPRSVAVIGGGISGLAAAHRLRELDPTIDVTVFEASDRLGGSLRTERRDGWLLEYGADNFITNLPAGIDLCRRLGLEGDLVQTRPEDRRAMVVRDGRLHPVPEGFMVMAPQKVGPLLTTPLLSLGGKLRMLAEALVPRRKTNGDESLASFATRRLGREAFERLVQPLVGGIYTADARKLSLAATLPRFLEMEREHGSLIRGAMRERKKVAGSGARYSLFVAPREGMSAIVEKLAERIGSDRIRLNAPTESIEFVSGQWSVVSGGEERRFDAIIVSTGAPVAAKMLRGASPELSDELAKISYAGSIVTLVGYRRELLARPLEGFGFVVPEVERRDVLAASYSSQKYPGRAPDGHVLIRVFLGGASRPDLLKQSDEQIRAIVDRELGALLGASGKPELFEVARWPAAMPQYHVGHLDLVARIESLAAQLPALALAGSAYRGVGVPQCIQSGEDAAERLLRI